MSGFRSHVAVNGDVTTVTHVTGGNTGTMFTGRRGAVTNVVVGGSVSTADTDDDATTYDPRSHTATWTSVSVSAPAGGPKSWMVTITKGVVYEAGVRIGFVEGAEDGCFTIVHGRHTSHFNGGVGIMCVTADTVINGKPFAHWLD